MKARILIYVVFSLFFAGAHANPDQQTEHVNTETASLPKATLEPFTASYKSKYKLALMSISIDGERKLVHLGENRWKITFEAEASIATLKEHSEFLLIGDQIFPLKYTYITTGLITEDDRDLSFDHDKKEVYDHMKKRVVTGEWQEGIQDNLTYMLQAGLDLSQGKTELSFPVFDRRRIKIRNYKVIDREKIKTDIGQLDALKIEQLRNERKRKIYAWLSLDNNYQLVRLNDIENGKVTYKIDITRLQEKQSVDP